MKISNAVCKKTVLWLGFFTYRSQNDYQATQITFKLLYIKYHTVFNLLIVVPQKKKIQIVHLYSIIIMI